MIDALDPRGGIAFASRRAFSLSDESHALREAPCVWIAPPAFQPEPIVSRMMSWAAERGAFQLGVFQEGEELTFATLDAVTEFVRRVYLRSGGGDGLDGGGPPVPPIPPEPGPELPPMPTEIEGGEARGRGTERAGPDLLGLTRRFTEAGDARGGSVIEGRTFTWTASGSPPTQSSASDPMAGQPDGGHAILERAAAVVLHEMLMRFPSSGSLEETERWHTAARALGCMIDDLGIWDVLLQGPLLGTLAGWAKVLSATMSQRSRMWPEFSDIVEYLDHREGIAGFFLLLFGSYNFNDYSLRQYKYRYREVCNAAKRPRQADLDPIEALSLMPLPRTLRKFVSHAPHDEANLTHLLYAVIGSPSVLIENGSGGEDASAIVLLAACWVVCQTSDMPAPAWDGASSRQLYRIDKLVQRAWEWLRQSLPALAFPRRIEEIITAASSLRYRANEGAEVGTSTGRNGQSASA